MPPPSWRDESNRSMPSGMRLHESTWGQLAPQFWLHTRLCCPEPSGLPAEQPGSCVSSQPESMRSAPHPGEEVMCGTEKPAWSEQLRKQVVLITAPWQSSGVRVRLMKQGSQHMEQRDNRSQTSLHEGFQAMVHPRETTDDREQGERGLSRHGSRSRCPWHTVCSSLVRSSCGESRNRPEQCCVHCMTG